MRYKILLLGFGALVIWAMPAMAFHDAGVAHCNGCHTMHNSVDGEPVALQADGETFWPVGEGNDFLLEFASATDTCLSCHSGSSGGRQVWNPDNGDCSSYWDERGAGHFDCQTAVNLNDSTHSSAVIDGSASGHTLVSAIGGRDSADDVLETSPGGDYPSISLRCTSCHDPHGTDAYRILYAAGSSYDGGIWGETLDAVGISTSSRQDGESDDHHNVYQSGYSEWCAECHELMHDNGQNIHPSGQVMTAATRSIYNGYIGSTACVGTMCPIAADLTVGAYLAQVPFEDPTRTLTSDTRGPDANARVSCVSCHRAHGSSAQDAGRWDFSVTALHEDGLNVVAMPNPYDDGQRSLCNKCHGKDAYDAAWEE